MIPVYLENYVKNTSLNFNLNNKKYTLGNSRVTSLGRLQFNVDKYLFRLFKAKNSISLQARLLYSTWETQGAAVNLF